MGLQNIKIQLWNDEALSNTTKSTGWIDCSQLQAGSFSFVWSGTSPVGEVRVQISNEATNSDAQDLTLSASLLVAANSGTHIANLDEIPNRYVRLVYIGASGTATAKVWFFGKGDAN